MRPMLLLFLAILSVPPAMASENGLITIQSHHSVSVTLDRLAKIVEAKGLTVFCRVDHSKGAKIVGIALRPTELLVFGNPKLGSQLFTSEQTAGIDLPMKALAWKGPDGKVWVTYNDPHWIAGRHHITNRADVVKKMSAGLESMIEQALAP
jgi:uncharacterized protein (DUF302 family)